MLQHARLSVVSFLLSAGTVGLFAVRCSNAFNPAVFHQRRPSTALFLEDDIADMIDKELQRQKHLKEFENEWMEKNKGAVLQKLNDDYMITMEEDELRQNFRQKLKDKKLAEKDPYAYCADRCIATGNCDVYEDLFELSPNEVVQFCSNCVMGGEEEECEIPDAFYELIDEIGYEKSAE